MCGVFVQDAREAGAHTGEVCVENSGKITADHFGGPP